LGERMIRNKFGKFYISREQPVEDIKAMHPDLPELGSGGENRYENFIYLKYGKFS
jgi:hypothetical protein